MPRLHEPALRGSLQQRPGIHKTVRDEWPAERAPSSRAVSGRAGHLADHCRRTLRSLPVQTDSEIFQAHEVSRESGCVGLLTCLSRTPHGNRRCSFGSGHIYVLLFRKTSGPNKLASSQPNLIGNLIGRLHFPRLRDAFRELIRQRMRLSVRMH